MVLPDLVIQRARWVHRAGHSGSAVGDGAGKDESGGLERIGAKALLIKRVQSGLCAPRAQKRRQLSAEVTSEAILTRRRRRPKAESGPVRRSSPQWTRVYSRWLSQTLFSVLTSSPTPPTPTPWPSPRSPSSVLARRSFPASDRGSLAIPPTTRPRRRTVTASSAPPPTGLCR
jgi:hypothetical protein